MGEAQYRLDDFELYQVARRFRKGVYNQIRQLPPAERDCLDRQMRRAAISVTNSIAEGHGRWHYRENVQFCRIARGSVEELIDDFNICQDQRYGDPNLVARMQSEAYALLARINGYIAYLRKTKQGEQR